MPLLDFSKRETYDSFYAPYAYSRANLHMVQGSDHWKLFDWLMPSPEQKIVLFGCGFGWIAEKWLEKQPDLQLICVDNSPWIQANKNTQGALPIYPTIQGRPTVIVTEDVMSCYDDAEGLALVKELRKIAQVRHWITQGTRRFDDPNKWAGDPPYNWKTIQDWAAFLHPDSCMARDGTLPV